ncbi:hypothetical protein [Acanthopleuribacter pedis]|uniref:MarR family transcriptional regulator n=1 Tax=Acanthopleuribacter pedis TaxID=442870 RepID=A0A8J7QC83_9BACT|nr:hypothetical protein [Acanthopleuribacter pedis]MBO1321777.1 hypothetical protein [Acanthopleuribacter pedis]
MNQSTIRPSHAEALYQVIQMINPLYRRLGQAVAENLVSHDLTVTQRAVLEGMTLFGRVNAQSLQQTFGIGDGCRGKALPPMVERGLICVSSDDSESYELTDQGRALFAKIREEENANLEPVIRQVTRPDIDKALDLLQKLNQAFTPAA